MPVLQKRLATHDTHIGQANIMAKFQTALTILFLFYQTKNKQTKFIVLFKLCYKKKE